MSELEKKYLSSLKGKVYKILPMKEEDDKGLKTYINSLCVELEGSVGVSTLPVTSESTEYIRVICVIKWLKENDFTVNVCRREIFKCLNIIETMLGE